MHLFDLPDELLVLCCEQIDVVDARALRLTCKRLTPLTNKYLFSHVYLLPTTDSAKKAREILNSKDLSSLVTTISIKPSLDFRYKEPKPMWDAPLSPAENSSSPGDENSYETNGVLSAAFKAMLSDIGLFRNLRRIELKFDWVVSGELEDYSGRRIERVEYREPFLRNVLRALNHPDHPALNVRSLSISNLQDLSNYETLQSEDFHAVMSRLDTLELATATEELEEGPEDDIGMEQRYQLFGTDLIDFWLAPVQRNLVSLKIYSNCYWGNKPKCDLRPLHFTQLRHLALGNMTFTDDCQLDWIISHGQTLQSLTLDDCPIVHDITNGRRPEVLYQDPEEPSAIYDRRWFDYFDKLAVGLPHLQHFGIGHGPWGQHTFDPGLDWGHDRVTAPFEAAAFLPAELHGGRYAIFYSGPDNNCIQWLTGDPDGWDDEFSMDEEDGDGGFAAGAEVGYPKKHSRWSCDPPQPSYPDCWERDQEALNALLAGIQGRRE